MRQVNISEISAANADECHCLPIRRNTWLDIAVRSRQRRGEFLLFASLTRHQKNGAWLLGRVLTRHRQQFSVGRPGRGTEVTKQRDDGGKIYYSSLSASQRRHQVQSTSVSRRADKSYVTAVR